MSQLAKVSRFIIFVNLFIYLLVFSPLSIQTTQSLDETIDDWNPDFPVNQTKTLASLAGQVQVAPQPLVWGKQVVWLEYDNNETFLVVRNLETNQFNRFFITTLSSIKLSSIYENTVAWLGNFPNPQIYLTNLQTGETRIVPRVAQGHQYSPSLWGDRLAFIEWPNNGMARGAKVFVLDLKTNAVSEITPDFTVSKRNLSVSVAIYQDKVVWLDEWSPGPIYGFPSVLLKDLSTGEQKPVSTSFLMKKDLRIWGNKVMWTQWDPSKNLPNRPAPEMLYIKDLVLGSESYVKTPSNLDNYWQFIQENASLWNGLVIWTERNVFGSDIAPQTTSLYLKNLKYNWPLKVFEVTNESVVSPLGFYQIASDEFLASWNQIKNGSNNWNVLAMRITPDYSSSFKLPNQNVVRQNDVFSYTIHVENSGVIEDDNLIVKDTLPDGVSFISSNYQAAINGQELIFRLGMLGSGESKDIDLIVRAPYVEPGTVLSNKAIIDPNKAYRKELVTQGPIVLQPAIEIGSFEPQEGETNVGINEELFVYFSGPINIQTLNGSSFYLTDSLGNKVLAQLSYNDEEELATLTPLQPLAYESQYTAFITGVQDTDGGLVEQESWSFTTTRQPVGTLSNASISTTSATTHILIVPGLAGSYLSGNQKNKLYGDTTWFLAEDMLNPWDGWMAKLYLDNSGRRDTWRDTYGPIRNKSDGVIRNTIAADFWIDYQEQLSSYDKDNKIDWFYYDWRKPVTDSAYRLKNKINSLAKTGKVTIIAHSLGGLVSKAYAYKYSSLAKQQVSSIITLGTPYKGAPRAFAAIKYPKGYDLNTKGFLNTRRVQALANNMSTAYILTPSRSFFNKLTSGSLGLLRPGYFYRTGVKPYRGMYNQILDGWLTYDETVHYLGRNHNRRCLHGRVCPYGKRGCLAHEAQRLRDKIDTYNPPIPLYVFAGWNSDGLNNALPNTFTYMTEYWDSRDRKIKFNNGPSPGDGTVPLYSAIGTTNDGEYFVRNVDHSALTSENQVITMIKRLLQGNASPDGLSKISKTNPYISTKTINWDQWTPYSPVKIHLYDAVGNHTGETTESEFEKNILGSDIFAVGDNYAIGVPSDQEYKLQIKGTDDGTFSLSKQGLNSQGEVLQTIKFDDIPVNSQTIGEITNPNDPVMRLDDDGDGDWDRNVEPQLVFNGDDTPITTASLSPDNPDGDNGWYKSEPLVSLSAENASGLGIQETKYRVDENEETIYQGPFVITEGKHNINYYSINEEGKPELPNSKEINFDRTKPQTFYQTEPLDNNGGFFLESPTLTLLSSDLLSGVDKTYWRLDGSDWQEYNGSFKIPLGFHLLEYFSMDIAGNREVINSAYFRVGADLELPSTRILLDGLSGNNDWFISDVLVTLSAVDNPGGTGVQKTEYSLDGGQTWNNYSGPLNITNEGITNVLARSIDNNNNLEDPAVSKVIKVDKTSPEAKISFGTDTRDLSVIGVDNLGGSVAVGYTSSGKKHHQFIDYTLEDEAGHQTTVVLGIRKEGNEIKAHLNYLSYNLVPVKLPKNSLKYKWAYSSKKNEYKSINQKIKVKDGFVARAHYTKSKGETKLRIEQYDTKKLKRTITGIVLLILQTDKGELKLSY